MTIERPELAMETLGLTLQEGKVLLAGVQDFAQSPPAHRNRWLLCNANWLGLDSLLYHAIYGRRQLPLLAFQAMGVAAAVNLQDPVGSDNPNNLTDQLYLTVSAPAGGLYTLTYSTLCSIQVVSVRKERGGSSQRVGSMTGMTCRQPGRVGFSGSG
jgi:hypothetical protein